jgi:FtsP/CotA-like multicopper oxidase with cupredoxin domain
MSAAQVGFGLYGALVVEDPHDGVDVAERADARIERHRFRLKGRLERPDSGGPARMVFGREGAYVLANGKVKPTLRRVLARCSAGALSIPRRAASFCSISMATIHGDRNRWRPPGHPVTVDALLITPGERADVLVAPKGPPADDGVAGDALNNRGYGSVEYRDSEDVLSIAFTEQPTLAARPMPTTHREFAVPAVDDATAWTSC